MEAEKERWKDVDESLGGYQVSNLGRVKSVERNCDTPKGLRRVPEKILNINLDKDGYPQVIIRVNGKPYSRRSHRLVAQAFIPNPKNKRTVNHINGIKTDNRVENLEWATVGENNMHACRTGLRPSLKGDKHGASKLKEREVLEIRYHDSIKNYVEIGLIYGISAATVCNIKKHKSWQHL